MGGAGGTGGRGGVGGTGGTADGGLQRFKLTMIIGLLLLLCANGASWAAIRQISAREAQHAVERCADPRGNLAVRQQFAKVADLIRRTGLKPTDPDYIAPKDAGKRFADSYSAAVRQMGPTPNCLGGGD